MVREVKGGNDPDDKLIGLGDLTKIGFAAKKLKKLANKKRNEFKRRQTGFGMLPGQNTRFGSANEDPYYRKWIFIRHGLKFS